NSALPRVQATSRLAPLTPDDLGRYGMFITFRPPRTLIGLYQSGRVVLTNPIAARTKWSRCRRATSLAPLPFGGFMRVGRRILPTTLMAGSAFGLAVGGSVLAVAAAPAAQAATTCAAAWSSTAVYTGGQQASENGINYTANW